MSLRTKILISLLFSVLLFAGLEISSLATIRKLKTTTANISKEEVKLRHLVYLTLLIEEQDALQIQLALTGDKRFLRKWAAKQKLYRQEIQSVARSAPKEKQSWQELRRLYQRYTAAHQKLVKLALAKAPFASRWALLAQAREALQLSLEHLEKIIAKQNSALQAIQKKERAFSKNATRALLFATVLFICLGVFVATTTAFVFRKRFNLLLEALQNIEARHLSPLPLEGKDEIGRIAHAFNIVLAKIREREDRWRNLSYRDSLTTLFNLRYFQKKSRKVEKVAKEKGEPVALLILDLDHFKEINDTWGHLEGDAVLKDTARALRKCTQEEDVVCRYGGEEFLILSPGKTKRTARTLAQRIRKEIKRRLGKYRLTVSIGIAIFPNDGEDFDMLLEQADIRLYEAKERGRDKVVT